MKKIKSFFIKIGQWFKKTFSAMWKWCLANKVTAGIIAGAAVVVLTVAIVVPVSVSAARRKNNSDDGSGIVDPSKNEKAKYTITWKDGDTVLYTSKDVEEGTMPIFDGEPHRAETEDFEYVFKGWDHKVHAADKDEVYNAKFVEMAKDGYQIDLKNFSSLTYTGSKSINMYAEKDGVKCTARYGYSYSGFIREINNNGVISYQAARKIKGDFKYNTYSGSGNPIEWKQTNETPLYMAELEATDFFLDKGYGFYASYNKSIHDYDVTYNETTRSYDSEVTYEGETETYSFFFSKGELYKTEMTCKGATLVERFSDYNKITKDSDFDWLGLAEPTV